MQENFPNLLFQKILSEIFTELYTCNKFIFLWVEHQSTSRLRSWTTFGIGDPSIAKICGPTITKSPHLDEGSSLYPNLPCFGEFCLALGNSGFWSCEHFLYMRLAHQVGATHFAVISVNFFRAVGALSFRATYGVRIRVCRVYIIVNSKVMQKKKILKLAPNIWIWRT